MKELKNRAIELMEYDADLFIEMVNELDNCSGFADDFRCYPMEELDDLFCDDTPIQLLSRIVPSAFDIDDDYFICTIYGLESTRDPEMHYLNHTDYEEVLENLIEQYDNITIHDDELNEIVKELAKITV